MEDEQNALTSSPGHVTGPGGSPGPFGEFGYMGS